MKTFLQELAEKIHNSTSPLDSLTFIFPNRRATLYFRKNISLLLDRPAFAPNLITIEDFIGSLSPYKVPDKLELIHHLYQSYRQVVESTEPFEKFFYWGEMLLRDFDEIDKYMVHAEHLFKDLSFQKELDTSFDFLTEDQRAFLLSFWGNFDEHLTENKKKFLRVWKDLPEVYRHFKLQLREKGLAYEGMIHKEVADQLQDMDDELKKYGQLHFVGFNALTAAEEKIMSYCVSNINAEVHWDLDEYYVNSDRQEAGKFFRNYQEHTPLRNTLPSDIPANFRQKKEIHMYGAASSVAQAKLMAQVLQEHLQLGADPEDTIVVLPDEKLLLPVLHGVAGSVDKLNVTMGFPLGSTPLYNLIELLVELQIQAANDHFNHRQVVSILGHPYAVAADAADAQAKRKDIIKNNWINVEGPWLRTNVSLFQLIFREIVPGEVVSYIRGIVSAIGVMDAVEDFDKEYAFYFIKLLNRLEEVIHPFERTDKDHSKKESLKSFHRLLRQLVQSQRIPFSGEPLRGLQIMGVLETRNLDFKNVYILSLNEGAFPSFQGKGSYIPFNIRKAYGLPTVEQQDAIYAYLFYRSMQRAEKIYLFYNSETDVLGQGEMSRYLQQLVFESGIDIQKHVVHNNIQPTSIQPITIEKSGEVMKELVKVNEGNSRFKGISPSALNNYIECRLRFYLQHVAKIREADEVEEDMDARILGNFLHDVMENYYKGLTQKKGSNRIEPDDLMQPERDIDILIDDFIKRTYHLNPNQEVTYAGQRLVVKEIVKQFALRILELDKERAPFIMEGLEEGGLIHHVNLKGAVRKAVLAGKIDRVDRKGEEVRIIDYKTGRDELTFDSVESLFARTGKRNKAVFQTLLYALLYRDRIHAEHKILPGLINRVNLFDDGFKFGLRMKREEIRDANLLLPEFEERLRILLEELFDPSVAFDQTEEIENCRYCSYSRICYRSG